MKTVLITGSSRGIGRETAIYFAQQGWNVIIHGFRHPEKLESLKNEILEEWLYTKKLKETNEAYQTLYTKSVKHVTELHDLRMKSVEILKELEELLDI